MPRRHMTYGGGRGARGGGAGGGGAGGGGQGKKNEDRSYEAKALTDTIDLMRQRH